MQKRVTKENNLMYPFLIVFMRTPENYHLLKHTYQFYICTPMTSILDEYIW